MSKLWTRPWKAEINKLLENLWVAPCSDDIWVENFKGISLYSTNPSHCHEDSLVLANYSHPRWLPWRKESRGVTLEDYVVWVFTFGPSPATVSVYIWTQLTEGTCTGCLHLDPGQLQQHHPPASNFHSSQVQALGKSRFTLCALEWPSSKTRVT